MMPNAGSSAVQINYTNLQLNGYQRSATVISNGQAILPVLQRSLQKATSMFRAGAYLHQYSMHGMEEADFCEAFRIINTVIKTYAEL